MLNISTLEEQLLYKLILLGCCSWDQAHEWGCLVSVPAGCWARSPLPRLLCVETSLPDRALLLGWFLLHCPLSPWAIAQSPPLTAEEITNYACKTGERLSRTDGIGVAFYRMHCNLLHGEGQRKSFRLIRKTSARASSKLDFFFHIQRRVYNVCLWNVQFL